MTYADQKRVERAVSALERGYEEEINLYSEIRHLTLEQQRLLADGVAPQRVSDLEDRKEELMALVGLIEFEMDRAKEVVTNLPPDRFPHRWRLVALLGSVEDAIEDVRDMERKNADLLQSPQAIPA